MIRGAEADARNAWQSELAAAGRMTPQLTKLVVTAGAANARTVDSLLAKDGDELSVDEYEELVVVLDGAIRNGVCLRCEAKPAWESDPHCASQLGPIPANR